MKYNYDNYDNYNYYEKILEMQNIIIKNQKNELKKLTYIKNVKTQVIFGDPKSKYTKNETK